MPRTDTTLDRPVRLRANVAERLAAEHADQIIDIAKRATPKGRRAIVDDMGSALLMIDPDYERKTVAAHVEIQHIFERERAAAALALAEARTGDDVYSPAPGVSTCPRCDTHVDGAPLWNERMRIAVIQWICPSCERVWNEVWDERDTPVRIHRSWIITP